MTNKTEAWLRGPLPAVPALLQPVAHALVQARDEVHAICDGLTDAALWHRPHGLASVGFHLQHLCGVLNRLTTYARNEPLSTAQLAALRAEGSDPSGKLTVAALLGSFDEQVEATLAQLKATPESSLLEFRGIGRAGLPSNVLGLLVHAAEHTMRHVGQLLVTARVVRG
jgi:uncharacterized damage-inducible protein DinB